MICLQSNCVVNWYCFNKWMPIHRMHVIADVNVNVNAFKIESKFDLFVL